MALMKVTLLPFLSSSVSGKLVGRGQISSASSPPSSSWAAASALSSSVATSCSRALAGEGRQLWSWSRNCAQLALKGTQRCAGRAEEEKTGRKPSPVSAGGGFSWTGAAGRRGFGVAAAKGATMTAGQEVVEKMDPVQQRLMFDDECILVDEKDNVVGHDSKYNCHLMEKIEKDNLLHRAFSVFLFNSKNELLLQKRSATKVTFPLVWTNTCCSHPLYRDTELIKENHLGVRNAAQRKLFDELGIEASDAPVGDFTCLGRILYKAASDGKWGEHELDYLVFMKRDVTVKPNPDEVADVMYVTREKLQEIVKKAKAGEDGVKLSPWFQLVVENFLYDWWTRLEEGTLSDVADMETIHKLV